MQWLNETRFAPWKTELLERALLDEAARRDRAYNRSGSHMRPVPPDPDRLPGPPQLPAAVLLELPRIMDFSKGCDVMNGLRLVCREAMAAVEAAVTSVRVQCIPNPRTFDRLPALTSVGVYDPGCSAERFVKIAEALSQVASRLTKLGLDLHFGTWPRATFDVQPLLGLKWGRLRVLSIDRYTLNPTIAFLTAHPDVMPQLETVMVGEDITATQALGLFRGREWLTRVGFSKYDRQVQPSPAVRIRLADTGSPAGIVELLDQGPALRTLEMDKSVTYDADPNNQDYGPLFRRILQPERSVR
jgi:hypothetical protein